MTSLFVALALALATPALGGPRMAVAALENHTGDASMDGAGPGVAAVLTSKFARIEALEVVERDRLEALVDEIELGRSGLVDPASAAAAGKVLGADYMVFGSIFSARLPSIAVTLWVVEVETGRVVASQEVRGEVGERGEEFFVLIDELAFAILDVLQMRLAARDRIAFGEVDVRQLETVDTYGRALDALSSGQTGDARQLLSRVVSLEPGFVLAESELAALRAETRARDVAFAHEAITVARARWKALEEIVGATAPPDQATPQRFARDAVRARFALMRGDFEAYFALEEARKDATTAFLLGHHDPRAPVQWDRSFHPETDFDREVRALLEKAGLLGQRESIWRDLVFWPWQVRHQLAEHLLRLGEAEQAMALAIENYQDPGPRASARSGPPHPRRTASRWDLHDVAVVLTQQEVRKAELGGDPDDVIRANHELKQVIGEAEARREALARYEEALRDLASPPRDAEALSRLARDEKAAVSNRALGQLGPALAGYSAFLARVDAGVYEPLRSSESSTHRTTFAHLADRWRAVADHVFREPYFIDQRLEHLLTEHEQAPPRTPEESERHRIEVEETITSGYRR